MVVYYADNSNREHVLLLMVAVMRNICLAILVVPALWCVAEAQDLNCPISGNYSVGFDGCYHRTPSAVLQGCRQRRDDCGHSPGAPAQTAANSPYKLATPSQVTAALVCDIAQAAKKPGQAVDLTKALISAKLTFSLVHKTSSGASLSIGAIPIFTGADIAPSLKLASIKTATTVATTSIVVEPAHLQTCDHSSPNDWLTSQVVTKALPQGVSVAKITESVEYIVSQEDSAGLKLNIIPISIGPDVSSETKKSQQIRLLFDFSKTPGSKPESSEM
jgi:hypothetical protein